MIHHVAANADTVVSGHIPADRDPVVVVAPGDEVVIETWNHWGDRVTPGSSVDDVLGFIRETQPGHGPHSLTGPVHVRDAVPGMTLQVDVLECTPRPHGYTFVAPGRAGRGLLPGDFDEPALVHFDLDPMRMRTELGPFTVPLAPFLGIMAVTPDVDGPTSSIPPGSHGGNLDLALLTAGSTLLLPVLRDGAMFYAGDAHAAQGDGEICLTAIETACTARLRFDVLDQPLRTPRAVTPDLIVTMGFDAVLDRAVEDAAREMIDLLTARTPLTRDEAYVLTSVQGDLHVTQVVNGVKGAHLTMAASYLG
jgi:acetamidase/formamidase